MVNRSTSSVMKSTILKTLRCLGGATWLALAFTVAANDNFPPKVGFESPINGTKFIAPADVKFVVQTADADGWVGTVTFFSGAEKIGESVIEFIQPPDPGALIVHYFKWHVETPGSYRITALATDDLGAATTSEPLEINVLPATDQAVVNIETLKGIASELGDFKTRALIFQVNRSGALDFALPVSYSVHGTAQNGVDYLWLSGELVIPQGAASMEIVTEALFDSVAEPEESVVLKIEPPVCLAIFPPPRECYLVGSYAEARAVISGDVVEPLPVVSIHSQWKTAEPCPVCLVAPAVLTIERTGNALESLVVFLEADGTATAGEDYQALPTKVEFPAGHNRVDLKVLARDDQKVEGPEVARVRLALPPDSTSRTYLISPDARETLIVIFDDEAGAPEVRLDIVNPKEGDRFRVGAAIQLSAIGVWVRGEIDQPVAFYDGDTFIGQSAPPQLDRLPIPGLPSMHTILWKNPPAGTHVLTARAAISLNHRVVSPPVQITVGQEPPLTVVRIGAAQRIAEETSDPLDRLPLMGLFTISRTGPTTDGLTVFVQYSGTATPGRDYVALPWVVTIPAGAASREIRVEAINDGLPEGLETLVAQISNCPPLTDPPMGIPCHVFEMDPAHERATVFLRDDGITVGSVTIIHPPDGANFAGGATIPIQALAIDLESYISRVEFWDGEERIGVSEINFIRAPDPGTPILHTFSWTGAAPGPHVLTARTATAAGAELRSWPVKIQVGPGLTVPLVGIQARVPETREPFCDPALCKAPLPAPGVFLLTRHGGDLSQELSVLMRYAGTAINEKDYALLRDFATFPAGQDSVEIQVSAKFDQVVEADETVVGEVQPDPSLGPIERYRVDPQHAVAKVVIHDNASVATRLEILAPRVGQHFQPGESIELRAEIVGPGSSDPWIVDFFDGDQRLGTTKLTGTIFWNDAGGGPHVIQARAYNPTGIPGQETLDATPVKILVGPGPAWPVVSLAASNWKTSEPCPVCRIAPGVVVLSRTGPSTEPLTVYLESDGTASPGEDYEPLPHSVEIPAGANSMQLPVVALDDQLVEGPEVVRVRIVSPEVATLGYLASVRQSQALVAITDDEAGAPDARLDIIEPNAGTQFAPGTIISISALGVYTQGEVSGAVEFYAGDKLIGASAPDFSLRPPVPCLPSVHTIWWTNPPPGQYLLTARSQLALNQWVIAQPVPITVGSEPPRILVGIEATQRIAEEDSLPFDHFPLQGVFTVSRTGPTTDSLPVYVQYSGSATSGVDYKTLPWVVTIPAGAASTEIRVVAIADQTAEGIETLVATISNCPPPWILPPCYDFGIDPAHESATVFLRDDGTTTAGLSITRPRSGTTFNVGATIPIEAVAIDLDGYISRVEFWDGEHQIGVSEIVFIRAPDPGTPIQHSFEWRGAAPGAHLLTARATRPDGTVLRSTPVKVAVGPTADRVVLEIEATDPDAAELGPNGQPDPAVFTIRRVAGPRDIAVPVFYSVGGTAANGIDYSELSGRAVLPAGLGSLQLVVKPVPDKALEGVETVLVKLEPPICIEVFPAPPECYEIGLHGEALARIRDNDGGANQPPRIAITHPSAGTEWAMDAKIEIVTECADPDGYVRKVEFFADHHKIGEQSIEFIRRPDPGQPQQFSFVWRGAEPGPHVLAAQATDGRGATSLSALVEIRVVAPDALPVVQVLTRDAFAEEPGANTKLNTASFRIRRSGPTNEDLVVAYSMHGTAENGADYELLPGWATIPKGSRSVTVLVTPLKDDVAEHLETVVLRLEPALPPGLVAAKVGPYRLGARREAVALIADPGSIVPPLGAWCLPVADGGMYLCFRGQVGANYRVEASQNFRTWETVFDSIAAEGALHFVDDEIKEHPNRFYRIAPEPLDPEP